MSAQLKPTAVYPLVRWPVKPTPLIQSDTQRRERDEARLAARRDARRARSLARIANRRALHVIVWKENSHQSPSVRCAVAELIWLADRHGPVTPALWRERIAPGAPRLTADRTFERLKVRLTTLGIPFRRVVLKIKVGGGVEIGILPLLSLDEVDYYCAVDPVAVAQRDRAEAIADDKALRRGRRAYSPTDHEPSSAEKLSIRRAIARASKEKRAAAERGARA